MMAAAANEASVPARSGVANALRASRSLWARVLVVVVLVVLSPVAFVGASSWYDARVSDRLLASVQLAASETAEELGGDLAARERSIERIARKHQAWIRVVNEDGTVEVDKDYDSGTSALRPLRDLLFGTDGALSIHEFDEQRGPILAREEVAAARRTAYHGHYEYSRDGGKLLAAFGVMPAGGPEGGARIIYVAESSRRPIRALYDLRFQLLRLTLFVLPMALILAGWLGWRIVRPLDRLRSQVLAKVHQTAPAADLAVIRLDEIGQVAFAFNTLLARLAERTRANEGFVRDLAHEFKNPVAAIRACVDTLGSGNPVDAQRAERLAAVLADSSHRLDALVTQLLELARAEGGMKNEPRGAVDLSALVRGIADVMRRDDRWREVKINVSGPEKAEIFGVSTRLESVARNLLDNAASFAGAGGAVEVVLRAEPGTVELEVSDTGPGIRAEDLPRVFERFYTTRGERRGTGLGLALVRAVVEAHGGRVAVRSEPGRGAIFTVALPSS